IEKRSKIDMSLNDNTLYLGDIEDELRQIQGNEQKINQEVEALTVELNAPARITLVEDATPPTTRDAKKWYMMFGMIVAGSFLAPLVGVTFLELLTRKVDSPDEVTVDLGLPVVGSLPMLPARALQ